MYCEYCGKPVSDYAKYCRYCGATLEYFKSESNPEQEPEDKPEEQGSDV